VKARSPPRAKAASSRATRRACRTPVGGSSAAARSARPAASTARWKKRGRSLYPALDKEHQAEVIRALDNVLNHIADICNAGGI
jgi:hypothetical protein